jgi:hypothetical protein
MITSAVELTRLDKETSLYGPTIAEKSLLPARTEELAGEVLSSLLKENKG